MKKIFALFFTVIIVLSMLGGCSSVLTSVNPGSTNSSTTKPSSTTTTNPFDDETESQSVSGNEKAKGLTKIQKNSFSMLNYLAVTAENIRVSANNRLVLEDIYTSLLNDLNPGAIDETTQDHLVLLRTDIKNLLNINIKRERLQFIYNQQKAGLIREAVPNPIAILSLTNAFDWKKLAVNAVYSLVDSYTSYKKAKSSADTEFLKSGWELDDEEKKTLEDNRDNAFDYMTDIVQEYGLDGRMTLNEQAVKDYAKICNIKQNKEKIHRLESEVKQYSLFGNYWLELADCYFTADQYKKCLDCIQKYNNLSIDIFRIDSDYANILPKVIVAAQNQYKDSKKYVSVIKEYTDALVDNTTTKDWALRYFAAVSYLDLYAKSNKKEFLKAAYDIAYDNVTILIEEQRKLNEEYLSEYKEITINEPDYRYMSEEEKKTAEKEYNAETKRLSAYNKEQKRLKKTALPSLYEPFVLNCDLLVDLANKLGLKDTEKKDIEDILGIKENTIFLSKPVNNHYSFITSGEKKYKGVSFEKNAVKSYNTFKVPASLLVEGSKFTVTINEKNSSKPKIIKDLIIKKVDRPKKTFDSFVVTITSKELAKYKWTKDSAVTLTIDNGEKYEPIKFVFTVSSFKHYPLVPDKVEFKQK